MDIELKPRWIADKTMFNHSWLKNIVVLSLNPDKRSLLDGTDSGYDQNIRKVWKEWMEKAEELLERFEREMSPRSLATREIFEHFTEQQCFAMGEALHENWKREIKYGKLMLYAKKALTEMDAAFLDFDDKMTRHEVTSGDIRRFRLRCRLVTRVFSKFPRMILV